MKPDAEKEFTMTDQSSDQKKIDIRVSKDDLDTIATIFSDLKSLPKSTTMINNVTLDKIAVKFKAPNTPDDPVIVHVTKQDLQDLNRALILAHEKSAEKAITIEDNKILEIKDGVADVLFSMSPHGSKLTPEQRAQINRTVARHRKTLEILAKN